MAARGLAANCKLPLLTLLRWLASVGTLGHRQVAPNMFSEFAGSWACGQARLYYLDSSNIIQEYCYASGTGWYQGTLGNLNVKANPSTGLAAVEYTDDDGGIHIRLFYVGGYNLHFVRHPSVETLERIRKQRYRGIGE